MMNRENLGFGMMRLPVKNGVQTDIDYDKLFPMVDEYLEAGCRYFDTSYVYHDGMSEEAVRKAVVERYPRERYLVATKFPTFLEPKEEQVEPIFDAQLKKLGVQFVDYYLLHNIQTVLYDGIDGRGGIVKTSRLFEHLAGWKKAGKVRHIGFSFHSSAKLLDRVLTEHPEVEFVQLAVNYIDWDSEMVQARACCEAVRRHGKKLLIMEPVKGGALASLPRSAETLLKAELPEASIASWAFRFLASLDNDVIAILSGMSTLEQVRDNVRTMKSIAPLTAPQRAALAEAIRIYRESAPIPPRVIDRYRGLTYHGISAAALLQTYSICQIQPVPSFADDLNYPRNTMAEEMHRDLFQREPLENETVLLPDGTDGTPLLKKAEAWLRENHF
jgi:predicted aldo/keto reductase-like oxidoreductase